MFMNQEYMKQHAQLMPGDTQTYHGIFKNIAIFGGMRHTIRTNADKCGLLHTSI